MPSARQTLRAEQARERDVALVRAVAGRVSGHRALRVLDQLVSQDVGLVLERILRQSAT